MITIGKNIIVQGAEKLIIIWMFLQCCFQNFFCSVLFPNLDRYSAAPFWKYISLIITFKQPYIYQNLWTYVRGCSTLDDLGQVALPLEFRTFFCLKKPCLSFPFSWIKSSRVVVLLIFSGGDSVGAFLLESHLTQYLFCSPSASPHEGQKRDTLPSILNWLRLFDLCCTCRDI